jgi:uncharacterized membrane protein
MVILVRIISAFLLMTINSYSISGYWWLLVVIILMAIDGYSIDGYFIDDY